MDLKAKKKSRRVLRASFTNHAKELETLLGENMHDLDNIQVSYKTLQQKYEQLNKVSSEILDLLVGKDESEDDLDDLNKEMDECDEYTRRFNLLSLRYDKTQLMHMSQRHNVQLDEISDAGVSKRKFQLPVIKFKQFDGNIRDWLSFWAQFQKVHDDPDIDPADKVEYLVQATVPSSRARHLVDSFPATGDNYAFMIDSLKSRFGREDLQIEVYVRELLKLVLNNAMFKGKKDISNLYDDIETQLRALESLGIKSDKYAAMLFPLIESCLPEELLRVWQRNSGGLCTEVARNSGVEVESSTTLDKRLKALMQFMRNEVENEQRISLASEGFGLQNCKVGPLSGSAQKRHHSISSVPTAADLVNNSFGNNCVFCNGAHESLNCFKAQDFPLEKKKQILSEKKACFRCLNLGHQSRRCRGRVRCLICKKGHLSIMCSNLQNKNQSVVATLTVPESENEVVSVQQEVNAANYTGVNGCFNVRVLIDTGSQRSYILETTAKKVGLLSKSKERLMHCLFGGVMSEQTHNCYTIELVHNDFSCRFDVLDQDKICSEVHPIFPGEWMKQLEELGIQVHDAGHSSTTIEILVGSDVAGRLYTGRRHVLPCGLVAVETLLGWTLMGKIPLKGTHSSLAVSTLCLFVNDTTISNLWELDVLGITEPTKSKSREELEFAAKSFFKETVRVNDEERYEVRLPWLEGHPPLPTNFVIAQKRLENTIKKLQSNNLFNEYDKVFKEWLDEKIIEEVTDFTTIEVGHYLPHRPVIKESSLTTKIRPVFDAGAKQKDKPSLNHCLEKGMNLIEQIPDLLIRFRKYRFGVISDIRKAFLQISINESDRDSLRFLWTDLGGKQIIYRHRRVVFGVNCSPFLLGATIDHHLTEMLKKCEASECRYSTETVKNLSKSFYVDNCITSVEDEDTLKKFIQESTMIMLDGKFDLRGWERTQYANEGDVSVLGEDEVSVLGLTWNTGDDTLSIKDCLKNLEEIQDKVISKRLILSMAQRIFDPIGFTSPVTLVPKLLLQRTWESNLGWDAPVEDEIKTEFCSWYKDIKCLLNLKIPRWIEVSNLKSQKASLHIFCDASSKAYACVIFLRVETSDGVTVQLITSKSRVAPKKRMTIPRLELLSATIAARLHKIVIQNLEQTVAVNFWSDSTTVLSWIRRQEQWATFVWNRVTEIRSLTDIVSWKQVPGALNPADLPSRGCSSKHLMMSKWWEGPTWLYDPEHVWPSNEPRVNEEEVNFEKRKTIVCMTNQTEDILDIWHLDYFTGKYTRTVRMIAWIHRFTFNIRSKGNNYPKHEGPLSLEEFDRAEIFLLKLIQNHSFADVDPRLKGMDVFHDEHGLLRLRSRVVNREDTTYFRFPIILPSNTVVVDSLIFQTHYRSCHVGTQGLMCILREKYWILGSRRYIKRVISTCKICRRYSAKHLQVQSPPLSLDRVRDAVVFEVSAVDFAGPLHLKSGEKVWICLFTCAVYRAIHFELASSLSTPCFIKALRRFIARRGRPKTMYSDCGTNFVGTENCFEKLNWDEIVEVSVVDRINWRFNPPASPWWGGFWERLVQNLKILLRKVLGRAFLNYEDLLTLVCDCEATINSRPLTYMSKDARELVALTPVMFTREQMEHGVPDCDQIDRSSLCKKVVRLQKLRDDLRRRFRNEYLGQLRAFHNVKTTRSVSIGEVVLIGNDNDKRLDWPLGRVIEIIPGKDGKVRLVRVATSRGQLLRPIQRIYPLEENGIPVEIENEKLTKLTEIPELARESERVSVVEIGSDKSRVLAPIYTRSGRQVKVPCRYSSSKCLGIHEDNM